MNEFLTIFKERGFFHQCTDEDSVGKLGNITAYIGFDLTADSLHVGSLLQIMILRWLKATGHNPIILLGGATTKVGDPSGKDESRPVITDEVIAKNKAGIAKVFEQFGLGDCKIVDNSEWLDGLEYLSFLRKVGRHFSVNRMIAKESVKARLERDSHMSFLEFNYMVFQAYDFVELAKRHECNLQIGGSDQWGNIVEGVELNRRIFRDKVIEPIKFSGGKEGKYVFSYHNGTRAVEVDYEFANKEDAQTEFSEQSRLYNEDLAKLEIFGLTTPLITTSDGKKMGKTADGAVWLSGDKFSAYDYYQFWRNVDDADVLKFLKFFTELPVAEIEAMKEWEGSAKINDAKKILAFEATKLCHGEDAAQKAANAATEAFEKGGTEGLPEVNIASLDYLDPPGKLQPAYVVFFISTLTSSMGEARRLIKGGGARINGEKVNDENEIIEIKDGMKLSSGKKKHLIVRVK